VGVVLTAADVFVILLLQRRGFRYLECLVAGLIFLIAGCFTYELIVSHPSVTAIFGGLVPKAEIIFNPKALYIAIGILGATVMPHNLYLHSSIIQTRAYTRDELGRRMAIKFGTLDSTVSLAFAFFINAAILILSAAAFYGTKDAGVAGIEEAHRLLSPALGSLAAIVFAVALLASGQNSTLTGTLAGQIVMEGFLNIRLRPWVRRLITRLIAIVPAVIVAAVSGMDGIGDLLMLSQVILSMQLSFAVIPLVMFTSDRKKMGEFANGTGLKVTAWGVTVCILGLNAYLLKITIFG
jgi:manganese transport protein